MTTAPEDYADAHKLLTDAVVGGATGNRLRTHQYHHDHEELWFKEFTEPASRSKVRDLAYWTETGELVREYLALQAGNAYDETLQQGFIAWLQRSPIERTQFENGDDMTRASLVDWFVKAAR